MTIITRSKISETLQTGLSSVFGNYDVWDNQWNRIFKTYRSEKDSEKDVEMGFTGLAAIKPEGTPVASSTMTQGAITVYTHETVGLSFTITSQAIDDNLYQNQFPQHSVALKNSLSTTKNMLAADVLNNAFTPTRTLGDGQPLCSTDHPTDIGTYANTLAIPTDLSEAGLEEALIGIDSFTDKAGLPIQTTAKLLIVPKELKFIATRLLKSQFRTGTANNDINAIYFDSYLDEGYCVNQYLTDPKAWFIKTNAPNGFKHFQRQDIETDVYVDFLTGNFSAKAEERYSFGVSNARCVYGSAGLID